MQLYFFLKKTGSPKKKHFFSNYAPSLLQKVLAGPSLYAMITPSNPAQYSVVNDSYLLFVRVNLCIFENIYVYIYMCIVYVLYVMCMLIYVYFPLLCIICVYIFTFVYIYVYVCVC